MSSIMHGCVEHLEWEGSDVTGDDGTGDDVTGSPVATVAGIHRQVQLGILRLLSFCVGKPPNIAHLLLGYETRRGKHVSESSLQDAGVLGSPRTVLHAILSLLQHSQDRSNPIGCHYDNPKLAELCYKVVFQLCSHRDLSTPTLRYLRNNYDFFRSQLSALPLETSRLGGCEGRESGGEGEMLMSRQVSLLHQEAWLMKSVAIEMRVTAQTQLRSHNERLVDLLLTEQSTNWNPALSHMTGGVMSELSEYRSEFDFVNEGRRRILILLDLVTFVDVPLPPLELQYFDQSAVEAAIQSCDTQVQNSREYFFAKVFSYTICTCTCIYSMCCVRGFSFNVFCYRMSVVS